MNESRWLIAQQHANDLFQEALSDFHAVSAQLGGVAVCVNLDEPRPRNPNRPIAEAIADAVLGRDYEWEIAEEVGGALNIVVTKERPTSP